MGNKVPAFDWQTGDFVKDARGAVKATTGAAAVEQIILKAEQTPRGVFLIYAGDPERPDVSGHTYGSDVAALMRSELTEDVKLSEIKRAISEAVRYDAWVTGVKDVTLSRDGENLYASAKVDHIYGTSDGLGFPVGG